MARQETQLSIPLTPLAQALAQACPLLSSLVSEGGSEFNSVRIQYRGQYDYMAVCKRWGPDGTPEVIFGSGSDFIGCILGLEAALDKGAWRPDKYAGQ